MRALGLVAALSITACTYDFDAYLPTASDAATSSDAPVTVACSESEARTLGGHCYFPINEARFDRVRDQCASRGAHLVTIGSAEEETLVEGIRAGRDRWIGLSRPNGSPPGAASFRWITGETSGFSKWGRGEPNGSGACARLRSSNDWGDSDCGDSHDAICERE